MSATATAIAALYDLSADIANRVSNVMDNLNSIRTTMNNAFSTTPATGHTHNNVDSSFINMGDSAFTSDDLVRMLIGGGLS